MPLVDLRGREREPEVLALLDAEPSWVVIGWSRDQALVACAGVERLSPDDVAVHALVAPDARDGRALLDAIANGSTGSRVVAEVDESDSAVYMDAGFEREALGGSRVRVQRSLADEPADPATVDATTLGDLETAIRAAWGLDTSDDPDDWSESNPARGQCAVTALLIRELLGGDILLSNVMRDGKRVDRHAWNRLPSGLAVDLTRDQFRAGEQLGEPRVEEPVLTHRNPERFATLRARVHARLGLDG
jgi:hypothetical protein